ncbi:MAG: hypothetical protein DWQ05_05195 [Calditrichaeota bacterium]|nr:MAG: hypothetical protein DWQ05_05195 [Calditrichota bacterium]
MRLFANIILMVFFTHLSLFAQENSGLQVQLYADMDDSHLDKFTHIEAAFILSGIDSADSLQVCLNWYENILQKIRDYNFSSFDKPALAQKIFAIMHSTILGDYDRDSTTLLDIIQHKKFNCVSATILYNLVCEEMGLETSAFETPTHVYTIFSDFDKKFIVENTSPMGFNILKSLQAYSRFLLPYYPDDQRLKIGLDQLYAYENRHGRSIDNTELLGLLAYNQAYFSAKNNAFDRAYEFVLTAQSFNQDSRSNIRFEKGLYFRWGKKCFDEKRFFDAFTVFADGFYRYPDNEDFARNTKATFQNCIQQSWQQKKWSVTRQITEEIFELQLLDLQDRNRLKYFLDKWFSYFLIQGDKAKQNEVQQLIDFADAQN